MTKISVVINTINEENNLPRALESVKDLASEVVVVDMESTDGTRKIAEKAGAKVFSHKNTNYVEPARNYAISKATGDWILILDADERISEKLVFELKKIVKESNADYFRLPRKNIIFGKWVKNSRWWPDYNIRFFKKGTVTWSEVIHSVPTTTGKGADLPDIEDNAIIHYHYTSIDQYIERMNRYTSVQAKVLRKEGYKFNWKDIIKKPSSEFLSRYFFGQGYKDGIHGLALAGLQSFSEFTLYLKVWQAGKFKKKNIRLDEVVGVLKKVDSEGRYWQADALVKEGAGITQRIKRKFRLP
jgi:(heptosyl)LPS beta-1,4-glucosyltransferase